MKTVSGISPHSLTDVSVDLLIGSDLSQSFVEEWGDLCEKGPITHPFCRPEFILAQAAVENRLDDLRILTVRSDNVLKGVLPLRFVQKRLYGIIPVIMLMSGGGEFTSRFDIVIASETVRQAVTEALWNQLQKERWDLLVFNDIVEGSVLEDLINKARMDKYPIRRQKIRSAPYRELDAQEVLGDGGINPVSKNFRQQIKRYERNLYKMGKVKLLSFENNDRELWEQFLQLEDAGWKGSAGSSILRSSEEKSFFEKVLQIAAHQNYLIWHVLKLDEKIIAMQFSFIWKSRYFARKIAYDETYSAYRPGHLLTNAIFRSLVAGGMTEYDFLPNVEEAKLKWTGTVRNHMQWHVYSPSVLMRSLNTFQSVIVPLLKRLCKRGLL